MIAWNNTMFARERSGLQPDLSVNADSVAEAVDSGAKQPPGSEERNEQQRAVSKAMKLLLYRQRTERELRNTLCDDGFSPEAVNGAITYVKSFGYLDDRRFAEVYLHSRQGKKSRSVIRRELREKGVAPEWIDLAFEETPEDEDEVIFSLLCRRAGEPHKMNEKELRRQAQYLARKGFSSSAIWKQIRRFQE